MDKQEIAFRQIIGACSHYVSKEYICSITLSGAAEEILGKIVAANNGINQLEHDVAYNRSFYQFVSGRTPSDRSLISSINRVKNELKHNDSGENYLFDANFEYEAAILIVKAVKNYHDAFGEYPNDKLVIELFEHLTP